MSAPVLALTMGDPAGVGPELCLRALVDPGVRARCVPVVFGNAGVLRRVAAACGLPAPPPAVDLAAWRGAPPPAGPRVVEVGALEAEGVQPGEVQTECGRASARYVQAAIAETLAGRARAVVTAPIHKEAWRRAGVPYAGHTEMLAALTRAPRHVMMLASDALTVSLVTAHTALADVPQLLNVPRLLDTLELTAEAMTRLHGRPARLAVCGLNPHAGEHGLFGDEEDRIIGPALETARSRGLEVEGPWPPDTAFLPARRPRIDAYVAMYHDQGLIPFKLLAFDEGVNVTLGLPIVRTSVDHGTAFDIAWRGTASARSLCEATRWAVALAG